MKNTIKKLLPSPFMNMLRYLRDNLPTPVLRVIYKCSNTVLWFISSLHSFKYREEYKRRKGKKNLYLLGTPHYQNMGDQAIVMATLELVEPKTLGYDELHQVYLDKYHKEKFSLRMFGSRKDVLMVQGGGYMGDKWMSGENFLRHVVRDFPNNRVIFMPQTIYYSDTDYGKKHLDWGKKVYGKHRDLHLVAREKTSYDLMTKYIPTAKVYLAPDMVIGVNWADDSKTRHGFAYFLRDDQESILTEQDHAMLKQIATNLGEEVLMTDTCEYLENMHDDVARATRMQQTLDRFCTAKLVVTDRLHGMLMAAVTQTPCITFTNYNHKVMGVYEWIKDLDYVSFMGQDATPEKIQSEMERLLAKEHCVYDVEKYQKGFKPLLDLIKASAPK